MNSPFFADFSSTPVAQTNRQRFLELVYGEIESVRRENCWPVMWTPFPTSDIIIGGPRINYIRFSKQLNGCPWRQWQGIVWNIIILYRRRKELFVFREFFGPQSHRHFICLPFFFVNKCSIHPHSLFTPYYRSERMAVWIAACISPPPMSPLTSPSVHLTLAHFSPTIVSQALIVFVTSFECDGRATYHLIMS